MEKGVYVTKINEQKGEKKLNKNSLDLWSKCVRLW